MRWLLLTVPTAALALLAPVAPAHADDLLALPVTVSVSTEDALGGGGKAVCSTTAVPPQEVDVLDPTSISGRTELSCGDEAYPSTLSAQLVWYRNDPTSAGIPAGDPASADGSSPLEAISKIDRFEAWPGYYRTVGESRVTYPYVLDTRRTPPAGCSYVDTHTVSCRVASSPVQIKSVEAIEKIVGPPDAAA